MKKALPITITILLLVTLVLMMMQTVTVYQVEPVSQGITTMKFYASITLVIINVTLVGGLILNILYFYKAYKLSRIKDKSKVLIDDLFDLALKKFYYISVSDQEIRDFVDDELNKRKSNNE